MSEAEKQGQAVALLRRLHRAVDLMAAPVAERHAERLQCRRGCAACCVDELTVFSVEAERIRLDDRALLEAAEPHGMGACAFLDTDGACRIYNSRPYVCRTQGLPLRWFDADDDALVEYRDICTLNDDGTPLGELDAEACWTIGPVEQKLAELEAMFTGGEPRRVRLRDLFGGRRR